MNQLSLRQVRLNHVRKQKMPGPAGRDPWDLVRSQLGLHSTDYWTPYLSVWARKGDYRPERVFQSLQTGDRLARINAFRRTVHVVHVELLADLLAATGPGLEKTGRSFPTIRGLEDDEVEARLGEFLAALDSGPASMRAIKKAAPALGDLARPLLLMAMGRGLVVRAGAPHARSTTCEYALTRHRIPGLGSLDHYEEATTRLLLRYVRAFGPVSVEDAAWWLPTTKGRARKLFESREAELARVEVDGRGLFMEREDLEAARAIKRKGSPTVWILPYEDHLPKAFRERSWYLPPELAPRLFPRSARDHWPTGSEPKRAMPDGGAATNQSGEIRPSVWVDGQVVGRWELGEEVRSRYVVMDLWGGISKTARRLVEQKRGRLESFVNERLMPISC